MGLNRRTGSHTAAGLNADGGCQCNDRIVVLWQDVAVHAHDISRHKLGLGQIARAMSHMCGLCCRCGGLLGVCDEHIWVRCGVNNSDCAVREQS